MNDIICPGCNKAFKVDEAGYASILKQVRDHQFEEELLKRLELAEKEKGITGENLLTILERRLDNVIYRLSLASSRKQARQLITHGHFLVNSKNVNIPSFLVKEGDVIGIKEKSRNNSAILSSLELAKKNPLPSWLGLDRDKLQGKVITKPNRNEVQLPVNENLIVEFY